ncbi:MAG: hypothetical protein WBP98_04555 [Candidatus Sulfotelmatobacter sp.]
MYRDSRRTGNGLGEFIGGRCARQGPPDGLHPACSFVQSRRMRGQRIWYLIPVRALGGRLKINLYPFGCRKDKERFEKYREAWNLLGRPAPRE